MKGSNPIRVKVEQPRPGTVLFNGPLCVSGWIISPVPIERVTVLVGGVAIGNARLTGLRPDVTASHTGMDALACGFRAELDITPYRGQSLEVTVEVVGAQDWVSRVGPVGVTVSRSEHPNLLFFLRQHLCHYRHGKPPSRGLLHTLRLAWRSHRYFRHTGRIEQPRSTADLAPIPSRPLRSMTAQERQELEQRLVAIPSSPLFSLIVPTTLVEEAKLNRTLRSIQEQIYHNYEILLPERVNGACQSGSESGPPDIHDRVRRISGFNGRLVGAELNKAFVLAEGDFVALVHPGDVLAPDALVRVAETLVQHPHADFLYSDEDVLEQDVLSAPFHKPAWSPELLLCQHYTGQLAVYRRSVARGGYHPDTGTAFEHDLALRVSEMGRDIVHIPHVLYHRARDSARTKVARDGVRAIKSALSRRGLKGRVRPASAPGVYSVILRPDERERVLIVIPTRDRAGLLRQCVESILRRTRYRNFEIVVVNNDSREPETLRLFESWSSQPAIRVLDYPGPFNYATLNNHAVCVSQAPLVLLLNNDTEVITPGWLGAMVGLIQQPGVGIVGAKLYFHDDTIQHAGCVLGMGRKPAAHAHKFLPRDHPGYHGQLYTTRNAGAVTGACLLTRRDIYQQAGGLDEQLAVSHNDTDFCLRVRSLGYRIVWTPEAELYHYESATRTIDSRGDSRYEQELRYLERKWGGWGQEDPYYNPNLSLDASNFALRVQRKA